jgi:TetR/AcrR family transcriptional repressor of nem operon
MVDAITSKERTRARILDEAAKAMREHGANGIGVAALMKRAGLTHGGFYAHFENRDDLVAHAVDRMFRDSDAMLTHYLGHDEAAQGLLTLIDYYLSEETRRRTDGGCPLPSLGGESSRMPDAARQRFVRGITTFRAALARGLTSLGSPDPETLAASVLAEMVGAMTLARALDDEAARITLRASREQLKQRLGLTGAAAKTAQ